MIIRTEGFEDTYDIYEDLGSGQFALVKRCVEKKTGKEYAAKFVIKRRPNSNSRKGLFREKILQEIEILGELDHSNIISLHQVFETQQEIILVLELVRGGELFEYISEKDHLSEEEAARFITQILEGVENFHSKNIVHLDLKPENVMLLDRSNCLIKIIDFGISRKLKAGEKVMETYGTPEFVAPEIIQYQPISTATDMWSIGVITYILLSGASPFLGDSKQETFNNITNIDYSFDDEYFGHTSDLAKDFIKRLFVRDVRKRATVKECLDHPWIKPRRRQDEELRRNAQINIEQFKSFLARRRWKVQMSCESRTVRTITTKYKDSDGNVKSKKRAELSGKSVLYEGEYSETDSEAESEYNKSLNSDASDTKGKSLADSFGKKCQVKDDKKKEGSTRVNANTLPFDASLFRRQKLLDIPNLELKPVKVSEFNELIDEHSGDEGGESTDKNGKPSTKLSQAELQEKINNHLLINRAKPNASEQSKFKAESDLKIMQNVISDESKEDEKSDFKVIDSTDEKTGMAIRTSIENKMKTNENVKVCKADNVVDVQETDDAIVKKITTKTRTTKSVVKTTTTTTTKKVRAVVLYNKIIRNSQKFSSLPLSLENIHNFSFGKKLLHNGDGFALTALLIAAQIGDLKNLKEFLQLVSVDLNKGVRNNENALHLAAESGSFEIIKLLHEYNVDLNALDSNDENAIHRCCRCNYTDSIRKIIEYLFRNGVSINFQNKSHETPLHIASLYGHHETVRVLCELGANMNKYNDQYEAPLHVACWQSLPNVVATLCSFGCNINLKNREGETALIISSANGCIENVKTLIEHKADLNLQDDRGSTALHSAVSRRHGLVALMLITAECNMEIFDSMGETPLTLACRENLVVVIETMCALGCRIDIKNKNEKTPLHIATENNDIDAVRCLCLAGPDLSAIDKDGLTAEDIATISNYADISGLLSSLRQGQNREIFSEQLIPTSENLRKIKIKIFGNSGVGKTTLIDSMNCSYINSFFRKTRLSSSQQKKSQQGWPRKRNELERIVDLSSDDYDETSEKKIPTNILDNYEVVNKKYTKGVEISQGTFFGDKHFSIWEFSGYSPYRILYDHFIGDQAAIHVIVYDLNKTFSECFEQCIYWLEFIKARITRKSSSKLIFEETSKVKASKSASSTKLAYSQSNIASNQNLNQTESISLASSEIGSPKMVILFVGTHADIDKSCAKNEEGQFTSNKAIELKEMIEEYFSNDDLFDLSEDHFILDSRAAWVPDIKKLINRLVNMKEEYCRELPKCTMFLNRVLFHLQSWRKTLPSYNIDTAYLNSIKLESHNESSMSTSMHVSLTNNFISEAVNKNGKEVIAPVITVQSTSPIIPLRQFKEKIRELINPLANDQHICELLIQLQTMGEIISVENNNHEIDFICYNPEWLCNQILGRIFSHERFFEVKNLTGIYTQNDIKDIYAGVCDDFDVLKMIFLTFGLCAEIEDESLNDQICYEFSALNFLSEPLPVAFQTIKKFANKQLLVNGNKESTKHVDKKEKTKFVLNGFQIRTSSFHISNFNLQQSNSINNMNSSVFMTPTTSNNFTFQQSAIKTNLTPSQLTYLFFRIQINLRLMQYANNTLEGAEEDANYKSGGNMRDSHSSALESSFDVDPQTLAMSRKHINGGDISKMSKSLTSLSSSVKGSIKKVDFNNFKFKSFMDRYGRANGSNGLSYHHGDLKLNQTRYCSRIIHTSSNIECIISLDHLNGEYLEVRSCAPESSREQLFYFVEYIYSMIKKVVNNSCPEINLEKHYLSFKPIAVPIFIEDFNDKNCVINLGIVSHECIYTPKDVVLAQYERRDKITSSSLSTSSYETRFVDLVCCGSAKIENSLIIGIDTPFAYMNAYTRRMLCTYLDKHDPMGRDWSILAFLLGLQDILPELEEAIKIEASKTFSKSNYVLNEWQKLKYESATIRNLIAKINDLDRKDVNEIILNTIALFKLN